MTPRLGIGAATAALLLTALTSLGPAAAVAADPMVGAPTVGQCFDMGRTELAAETYTEAAVDCSARHTSTVLAVATLPAGMTYDDPGVDLAVHQACNAKVWRAIGTSTLGSGLTAYGFGWFLPTEEQRAAGATWLRCDLVLLDGARPLPLPDRLDVGRVPFSNKVARCLAGRDLHVTVCAQRHTYRATSALEIRSSHYPSRRDWLATGRTHCSRRVSTPRDYQFSWVNKLDWQTGEHTLVCYSRTRR